MNRANVHAKGFKLAWEPADMCASCRKLQSRAGSCNYEEVGLLQKLSSAGLNKPRLIKRRDMGVNLVINRIAGFKGKGRRPGQLCCAQHFP